MDKTFSVIVATCSNRVEPELLPRPANALNIEIGSPSARCLFRSPDGRGLLWYMSGGSVLAYGVCEECTCEHLKTYVDCQSETRQEYSLGETGAVLIGDAMSYKGRIVVRVRLEGGRSQGFYKSTGQCSKRAGEWFPFDGIKPVDGGLSSWFDKAKYCCRHDNDIPAHLNRHGTEKFKEIGAELKRFEFENISTTPYPSDICTFIIALKYASEWDEIETKSWWLKLNVKNDGS